jgi:REP element-mobilizing transposase RayT
VSTYFYKKAVSRKYKFGEKETLHFISFAVVYWIDVFIRNEYMEVLLNSWKFCMDKKGLEIYGWCIMTSHVHMIISSNKDPLEDIMRDMKKYTSNHLRLLIKENPVESRKEWMLWLMERAGKRNSQNVNFQFWQQDNHPVALRDAKMAHQKLDYIHYNPVQAGFVEKPEDYLYSSARSYNGIESLIETSSIEPLVI